MSSTIPTPKRNAMLWNTVQGASRLQVPDTGRSNNELGRIMIDIPDQNLHHTDKLTSTRPVLGAD